ncbi:MAG: DNA/RNA non-specific endonuclease [Clostridia bacterium]|nr:DNA/RNA non-specific endonuclease [Clostridia bacterium]
MDTAPFISHGRTLVPARFVAESFGAYVYWDSANYNVLIYTNARIPEYSGSPYVVVNDNTPFFKPDDYTKAAFERYSSLDSLGRCGPAYANICTEIMPTEPRGEIGNIKPSGWHTVKYDFVDGKYLYNRCHLIGYQLAGENDNEKNLITGTRYMNVTGMLPFENEVDDYVERTNNHVLYRVTPFFTGNNLIADGVLMEAYSVEDNGKGVCFNVFCYNVQPGVVIDYKTGESHAADGSPAYSNGKVITNDTELAIHSSGAYVGNKSSKKFHLPSCTGAKNIKDKNKIYFTNCEEAVSQGYEPCGICNP